MSIGYPKRFALGLILSLAIGLLVVASCNTVWATATGAPIGTMWRENSAVQVVLAGLPYFVLAVCGIGARRAWIVALILTAAFWGYYLWDIIHYAGVGANIGIGILMMASPIAVTASGLLAASIGRNRQV
jgi:hypothetical protein